MNPNQVAKALRQIATKIDNSKSPNRELVARDLKRILAAVGEYAYGESKDGPWTAVTPEELAKIVQDRKAKARPESGEVYEGTLSGYSDPDNGIILFLKKGDRIFQIECVHSVHGEDAISDYAIDEIDPETQTSTAEHMEQGDDILSMIQEA